MKYLLITFLLSYTFNIYSNVRKPVLWDISDSIYNNELRVKADNFLTLAPVVVTNKSKTISGDKHNYESIARYAWPDINNPNGPYIIKDGFTSPEHGKYDEAVIPRFATVFKTLVEAYYFTRDKKYLEKSMKMLDDWFVNKDTYMYPNFDYGQYIPGKRNNKGYPGSICEAYNLIDIMEGIDLLYSLESMDIKLDKKIQKWFKQLAKWLISSELGIEMCNVEDNLGVIYDVMLYRIGLFTGQKKVCKFAVGNFTELRIKKHIADDGRQPVELKRNRAFQYSVYNLSHFIDFCMMQKQSGDKCNEFCLTKIDAALSYLLQFVGHKDRFTYHEIGDWETVQGDLLKQKTRVQLLKMNSNPQ